MRKWWTLLGYEIKYAWLGLWRHLLVSLSAMSAVMVTLFLIVAFLIVGVSVESFSKRVEQDLSIHVVLDPAIQSEEELQSIQEQIESLSQSDHVVFSSKEEELQLMIEEKGEAFQLYEGEENPLGNAFFVYAKDGEQIQELAKKIREIPGVAHVAYGGKSVTGLVALLAKVRTIGIVAIVLLLILSFYLIYNTIRTTIYSRSDDIIIMRQVGAENSFVKRPFEIEGIMISLCGAIIPFGLVAYGYPKLYESLHGYLFARILELVPVHTIIALSGSALIVSAILIGWFASFLAVNKYIREKR